MILFLVVVSLVFLLVANLIGRQFINVFIDSASDIGVERKQFLETFLGTILVIVIYATLNSGFTSVYTYLSIPLLIYLGYCFKKIRINLPNRSEYRGLLAFAICFAIVNLLIFSQLLDFTGDLVKVHDDFPFYAGLSEVLHTTGIENRYFDPALRGEEGFMFYHYFENWLNAFFLNIPGIGSLKFYMFVTIPIFFSQFLFGFYVLVKDSISSSVKAYNPLVYLPLICAPFYLTFRGAMWNETLLSTLSLKNAIVGSILLILISLYKKVKMNKLYMIGFFLSTLYPTVMFLLIPLFFVDIVLFKKVRSEINFYPFVMIAFILGVFLFIPKYDLQLENQVSFTSRIIDYLFSNGIVGFGKIVLEPFFRLFWMLLCSIPILIFLKLNKSFKVSEYKDVLKYFFITYFIGSFGVALIGFNADGHQILRNTYDVLMMIILAFVLVKSYYEMPNKKLIYGVLLITLVFNGYRIVEPKKEVFNAEAKFNISNLSESTVLFANAEKFYNSANKANIYFKLPLSNQRYFTRNYFPRTVSIQNIPESFYAKGSTDGGPALTGDYYLRSKQESLLNISFYKQNKWDYLFLDKRLEELKVEFDKEGYSIEEVDKTYYLVRNSS